MSREGKKMISKTEIFRVSRRLQLTGVTEMVLKGIKKKKTVTYKVSKSNIFSGMKDFGVNFRAYREFSLKHLTRCYSL